MVSIRYVQQQQEADSRRARYEESRRIANEMCVQRARTYAAKKTLQQQKVRSDVKKQWECEIRQQTALIDRLLYDSQVKQGEGMCKATELKEKQQLIAEAELNAWVAENALQEERHRLARAQERITRALQHEPQRSIIVRKKAVRLAEDKRSRSKVAQPRPKLPSFVPAAPSPLTGALSHTSITYGSHTKPNIHSPSADSVAAAAAAVVVVVNSNCHSPARGDAAATAAAQYSKQRQEAIADAQATVEEARRSAAERAATVLLQREESVRDVREAARRRVANVEALQQRISAAEPQERMIPCIGEQKTRRAAVLRKRVEAEFESMFLRDALTPVEGLDVGAVASHNNNNNQEKKEDEDAVLPFPLVNVSCLLPKDGEVRVQLSTKPLIVRPIENEDYLDICRDYDDITTDAAAAHDSDNQHEHNDNENGSKDDVHSCVGSDAPCAALLTPEPTPMSAVMSPVMTEEEQEEDNKKKEGELQATTALLLFPSTSSPQQSNSKNRNEQVELQHEQFLRNLKTLQEKLSKAAGDADVNAAAESSALHANVSISSMSSVITPMRRPISEEETTGSSEIDTSGNSSSGSSLSSTYSRSYPTMTADQLKAALLRMKQRMRSV